MAPSYIGIDLTSGPERPSACAVLSASGSLLELRTDLREDGEIIALAVEHGPVIVGIDSPLGLPLGLCCLEEDCPCSQSSPLPGRIGERALAALGIGCFFTTKRSIIKRMVYRGIALRSTLSQAGFQVMEVYPYATKRRLWPSSRPPKKSTPAGLSFLRDKLHSLIPCLEDRPGPLTHDMCDALLAAYTLLLYSQGRAELLGVEGEVQIVIPSKTPEPSRLLQNY